MVGVQLSGGLGNQMFEYALYLRLKAMGREVKIDDFTCYGAGNRRLALSVFGIGCQEDERTGDVLHYARLTQKEYVSLTDSSLGPACRIRRKLMGRRDLSYREYSVNYDPAVLEKDPVLLLGCFQSEKYFAPVRDKVREAYRFRNLSLSPSQREYERRICSCASVGVHIRRGDYLDPRYRGLYVGICGEDYYKRAMEAVRKQIPGAVFFFFSNDTPWVKAHYDGPDCVTVEGSDEDTGYVDLYLMSRCRHQIMANSSFSWWGAWLNQNPDKRVMAPARWLNRTGDGQVYDREECRDIYTEEMTVI